MKLGLKKLLKGNLQQVLFVFLAFLVMVLVSYFYVSGIVRDQIFVMGEETMNTMQTAVSASLSEAEYTFSSVTQAAESLLTGGQSNEVLLAYLVESNQYYSVADSPLPDFMKLYGYVRGEFLDGSGWVPPSDYVAESRPWYTAAIESNGDIVFSEPYIDSETGGMCISFSKMVFDQNQQFCGVLAIDLKLNRITDYVEKQQISNNGYGILISNTMMITAHPQVSFVGTDLAGHGDGYQDIARMLGEGKTIAAEPITDWNGSSSIAFFRPVFDGWYLGIIIPKASYYAPVYQLGWVLGILGLILMTILSSILVRTKVQKMRSDEESQSKSNFLARMSHEMRTPMNAIIGMTNIAMKAQDEARVKESLKKIDAAAQHLLGVINDVLDMSKIEAGKLELSETDFYFQELLEQVKTVVDFRIKEKQQKLTFSAADDIPKAFFGDQQRLAQVLTNLLGNAVKFTDVGGHIDLAIQCLEISGRNCTLEFKVSDDGIGITREQQEKLFHSFEQADGSISRKYGGTGLGLAISKRIVEQMGGNIWVESEHGVGSTFVFFIKIKIADKEEAAALLVSNTEDMNVVPGMFKNRTILLAEDVEINQEILMAMLEDTGVEIACADNGQKAVDLFRQNPSHYDLIFMDIQMPEVDGYQAARMIRELPMAEAVHIPIIAMTANVFKEDIEKCLAAGMNGHIGKPLDFQELMVLCVKYLDDKKD